MLAAAVTAVLIICIGWALIAFVSGGLGWLVLRGAGADGASDFNAADGGGPHAADHDRSFRACWIGLAFAALLAEVWNLALPVNRWFGVVALVCACAGWMVARKGVVRSFKDAMGGLGGLALVVLAGVTAWAAHRASGPPRHVDAMIYHLSAVRWYAEYPIVRGLGNLHDRLALNNVNHLLQAALETGGWRGRSEHLLNSFLVVLVAWRAVAGGARLLRGASRSRLLDAYSLFLLTPAVSVAVSSSMSSPTTDWPAMAAALVAVGELLVLVVTPPEQQGTRLGALWGACSLFTLSAAVKVGGLPLGALGSAAALGAWWFGAKGNLATGRLLARALGPVAFCGLMMAVWMYRNTLLTGYVVYPVLGRLDRPWTLPLSQADLIGRVVAGGSRNVTNLATVREEPWVRAWLRWQFRSINFGYTVLPLVVTAAGLAAAALGWRRERGGRGGQEGRTGKEGVAVLLAWLCIVPAMGAWWVLNPMPRMGGFLFWAMACTAGALGLSVWTGHRLMRGLGVAGAVALAAAPIAGWLVASKVMHVISGQNVNVLYITPGPDHGLAPVPAGEVTTFTTRTGMELIIPRTEAGCGDPPLPSTSFPHRHLALRDPGNLGSGFVLKPSLAQPASADDVRAVTGFIAGHAHPGDKVYANADAESAVRAAVDGGLLPGVTVVSPAGGGGRADFGELLREYGSLLGAGRVWFVIADGPLGPVNDELQSSVYALDNLGIHGASLHTPGISACLYEMYPR